MQNEKIIEIVEAAKKRLDSYQIAHFEEYKKAVAKGDKFNVGGVYAAVVAIASLEYYAQEDLKKTCAKTSGRSGIKKSLEKICKTAEREALKHYFIDKEGRQVVCDCFRMYRINDPVELAAEYAPDNKTGDMLYTLERIYAATKSNNIELPVPSAADLKTYITTQKAIRGKSREPILYDFGKGRPSVNAEYLADILTVYGDDVKLYACDNIRSTIRFESPVGDGMLCPMNKTKQSA